MNQFDKQSHEERSALDWVQEADASEDMLNELEQLSKQSQQRQRKRWVVGAVALVIGVFSLITYKDSSIIPGLQMDVEGRSESVIVANPLLQVLPDGTKVELSGEALLDVQYTDNLRKVSLRQGMAHFQVTKNAARPFVVVAQGVSIRAVGTAFSVEFVENGVDVLVTEGRIAVDTEDEARRGKEIGLGAVADVHELVSVSLSQDVSTAPRFAVSRLAEEEVSHHLAWRMPRLLFSGAKLVDVVAAFNRHNKTQITLADDSLSDLQISGVLRADRITALTDLLHANFGVAAQVNDSGYVLSLATAD